jgi:hypothetical protein
MPKSQLKESFQNHPKGTYESLKKNIEIYLLKNPQNNIENTF